MILIFSDDFDFTTHEVCKWLSFYKQKYFLITNTNKIIDVEVQIGIEKIIILKTSNDEIINLKNIKTYWYRRGRFFYDKENRFQTRDYFDEKIINEWEIVNDYLMSNFINNDYFNKKVNKLAVLEISKKLGFIRLT